MLHAKRSIGNSRLELQKQTVFEIAREKESPVIISKRKETVQKL